MITIRLFNRIVQNTYIVKSKKKENTIVKRRKDNTHTQKKNMSEWTSSLFCFALTIAVWICWLPSPAVSAHLVHAARSLPPQHFFGLWSICVARCNVTRTTCRNRVRDRFASSLAKRFYHLQHRGAVASAKVKTALRDGLSFSFKIGLRQSIW